MFRFRGASRVSSVGSPLEHFDPLDLVVDVEHHDVVVVAAVEPVAPLREPGLVLAVVAGRHVEQLRVKRGTVHGYHPHDQLGVRELLVVAGGGVCASAWNAIVHTSPAGLSRSTAGRTHSPFFGVYGRSNSDAVSHRRSSASTCAEHDSACHGPVTEAASVGYTAAHPSHTSRSSFTHSLGLASSSQLIESPAPTLAAARPYRKHVFARGPKRGEWCERRSTGEDGLCRRHKPERIATGVARLRATKPKD